MRLTIEIDEDEILKKSRELIIEDIAGRMLNQFRNSAERYNYRNAIKECVREAIKSDLENLSDRAVQAAAVSIANKGLKKLSVEELIARISGGISGE